MMGGKVSHGTRVVRRGGCESVSRPSLSCSASIGRRTSAGRALNALTCTRTESGWGLGRCGKRGKGKEKNEYCSCSGGVLLGRALYDMARKGKEREEDARVLLMLMWLVIWGHGGVWHAQGVISKAFSCSDCTYMLTNSECMGASKGKEITSLMLTWLLTWGLHGVWHWHGVLVGKAFFLCSDCMYGWLGLHRGLHFAMCWVSPLRSCGAMGRQGGIQ